MLYEGSVVRDLVEDRDTVGGKCCTRPGGGQRECGREVLFETLWRAEITCEGSVVRDLVERRDPVGGNVVRDREEGRENVGWKCCTRPGGWQR